MRAFIFSLDAFVAFTLALVAIYSLIFFSSVPSSYYYLLTQGHFLTRDTLMSMSTTVCTDDYGVCLVDGSVLDNVAARANSTSELALREGMVNATIGEMIPAQFGYRLEVSDDEGGTWELVYDTAQYESDLHAKSSKKLSVSSQVITFGYSGKLHKFGRSPYNYLSCGFAADSESDAASAGEFYQDWGNIVCGVPVLSGNGGSGSDDIYLANTHPENVLRGDIVPSSDVKVVRFTVYI